MDWLRKMIEVYRSDEDKVNAFGYVLYTDENPNTKKILRDADYWKALDEISGENWIIFAIKPKVGSLEYPDIPPSPPGRTVFYDMEPIWEEPSENKELLSLFGVESTRMLPLFVVFVFVEDKYFTINMKIKDNRVEDGFNSLKYAVCTVKKAIDQIDPKNWKNDLGVFGSIEMQIGHHKNNKRIIKLFQIMREWGALIPIK